MPGVADPGFNLVRLAIEEKIPITCIPGPTALTTALALSGLNTGSFKFIGFLPQKTGKRRKLLEGLTTENSTLVFYTPARNLVELLEEMLAILGDRQAAVARELTKLHEEIFRGSLQDCIKHYSENPPRGEVTLVVAGSEFIPRKGSA